MGTIVFVFAAAITISPWGDPPIEKRDRALEQIHACLQRHEVSSRECKKLSENIQTLVEVYRGGDKSVLPALFHFTYLSQFYGDALLTDSDGFLAALSQLPEAEQKAVALGISGGMSRLPNEERFAAIRTQLTAIPDSSPFQKVAQICLKALETNNVSFLVNYFPPQTFTGRSADLQVSQYSSEMYVLGEKPLWPPASTSNTVYRFTYLGAFTGPAVVTLTVQPDGTGLITAKELNGPRDRILFDKSVRVPGDRVANFLSHLEQAHFWGMPTESSNSGLDGAEWMLEGTQNGKYHAVVRWCPGTYEHSAEDTSFAKAARMLFELAGHKLHGGC